MCVVNVWKLIITFFSVIVIYSIKAEKSMDGVQSIFNTGTAKLKAIYGDETSRLQELQRLLWEL
jgi:hypothetical protein